MLNPGRLILIIFILLSPLLGAVEATVDENQVISGERVYLKIEAFGERVIFPQINKIGDLNVTTEGSRRLEWFDGNKSVIKWVQIYEFTPKKSLTIPSFEVEVDGKIERTKPIFLQVKRNLQTGSDTFRIEIDMEKERAYVGEPVTVTIRFKERRDVPVMSVDFVPIKFENFWVKRVGKLKRYAEGEYLVHEIKYLFFPQIAGDLRVGPAQVKVATAKKIRDAFGFIVRRPQWITLDSAPLILHVEPLPKGVDLVGKYSIEADISSKEVEAGRPVTLTVKVEAEGNIEDFDLSPFKIEGVTIYAQEPKIEQRFSSGIYSGRWVRKFVLIADRSYTVEAFKIRYFDPQSERVEAVFTKPIEVKVKGSFATENEPTKRLEDKRDLKEGGVMIYIYAAISFLSGMALMYLALKFPRVRAKRKGSLRSGSKLDMLQQLMPYISESKEAAQMAENLYANLFEGRALKVDKKRFLKLMEKLRQ